MNATNAQETDVLVIGSGIAGLSIALKLARHYSVTLIAKASLQEGSSAYAQGGIAAVLDPFDSVESHIKDTMNAGAGLCDKKTVRMVAEKGVQSIYELIEMGVPFSKQAQSDRYHLTKEGGHSHRRVIHAADHTGKTVTETLVDLVKNTPNITMMPNHMTVDLILNSSRTRCIGCYVLDQSNNHVKTLLAHYTVLATGGASKTYLYTSNPDTSTGDGIAMAWRAGCSVTNMEFNQFHPTCLFHPKDRSFLISEAVRGEGGILKLPSGEAFMQQYDERADLAPRDIVARAIDQEMKKHGVDCVYLDISHKPTEFIIHHFPTIYARCLKVGIDITKEAIPVVPAAHYTCGGISTDLNGQTDIQNLFAIGETAYTGLHGANRLASNSLVEGLVFAETAYQSIHKAFNKQPPIQKDCIKDWDDRYVTVPKEKILISHDWDEVRRLMWDYVGIVRTDKRLKRALKRIKVLKEEINEYYRAHTLNSDLLELRNLTQVAELMVKSALRRKESRGLNYNLDYPDMKKRSRPTVLRPKKTKPT
ncbi:L-aspartate oxidase [Hydrogenovibrio crunogenus]|uniref:L-aspartate oxidase n=1 Tax=Hydrogenovibrio crunogenus TaxID=39765 RepID=A0A4P7NY19_9GAMM|nr:L-aspartate oxidase [Hydrogenovibrio crunogenus]QBZ82690.1 L-aspartate oxidase [Hydrogenovibrio crunogenus]RUM90356.1 MAG: L-aspartate oxidase [Thiomicrospira sp.]